MDLQPRPVERASYPPRPGNHVSVLVDGHEAFGRIFHVAARASASLWITVSFVDLDMPVPGDGRPLVEFLDARAHDGVDVRLLFWWSEFPGIGSFRGDDHELEMLRERGSRIKMRWDHIHRGCHHQKSHVIDGETAFVGGMNLSPDGLSVPGHHDDTYHDVFAELRGPAVADVAANFTQRWNQATETRTRGHAFPSTEHADDIRPSHRGGVEKHVGSWVQVVRTIGDGLYSGRFGWQTSDAWDMADGEHGIRDTLVSLIDGARRQIYIENQFLLDPDTIARLGDAARRGVEVIAVVPCEPDPNLSLYPDEDMQRSREALASLARCERFGLFGLTDPAEPRRSIYVHTKLMIVDDRAMTLGSANLWPPSYDRDSELNVCVWDPALCESTRRRLWDEHLLGLAADGIGDWRSLASVDRAAPGERRTRLVALDPASYYTFTDDHVAPWNDVREASES